MGSDEVPAYSQCGEDHLLSVLLRELGQFCAPTMAELGAGDPFEYSNSRFLIEQGWQVLLVEANPELVGRLSREYANAANVTIRQAVLAPEPGTAAFHISRLHWALSGIGGVSYQAQHGPGDIEIAEVATERASELLRTWIADVGEIGVLCIDLEGLDLEVLHEILATPDVRADVVIIEALDRAAFDSQWQVLVGHGYLFVRNLWLSNVWVRADLPAAERMLEVARAATIPLSVPH